MDSLVTERLVLRRATEGDAPFIQRLLTDPDWLRWIGDRGVRDEDTARTYIRERLDAMHARHGVSLLLVETRSRVPTAEPNTPIGLCGLIRRDTLDDFDLGYAFLPEHRGRGFAFEAASAVLAHGHDTLGLQRIVALTLPDNERSQALLTRLGFRLDGTVVEAESGDTLVLYSRDRPRETGPAR